MSFSLEEMLHAIFAKKHVITTQIKSENQKQLEHRPFSGLRPDQALIKQAYERLHGAAFAHTNEASVFLYCTAVPWTSPSLPCTDSKSELQC